MNGLCDLLKSRFPVLKLLIENQSRPQMPILSVKNKAVDQSENGLQMMTIEDNSDLRAAMNFT